ncbi:hypothetical protein WDU94_010694 [Cyamophila willieti]
MSKKPATAVRADNNHRTARARSLILACVSFSMEYYTVLVFLALPIIIPEVFASENQFVKENDLYDIISKQNGMLAAYNKELDDVVPFKALRESLKALDDLAKDYNGQSRYSIYKATTMGYEATDNYYKATDKVFRWCSFTHTLITYILNENTNGDKTFELLKKITYQGLSSMNESIAILEQVNTQLTRMTDLLQPVPKNLKNEITQMRRDYEERKQEVFFLEKALADIRSFVSKILSFLNGIVGFVLDLERKLGVSHISWDVIEGHKSPDDDENMRITEVYYTSLIDSVQGVMKNIAVVKSNLSVETTSTNTLYGSVQGRITIGQTVGDVTKKELKELLKSVNSFMDRHSGGENPILRSRRRREITKHGFDVNRIQQALNHALDQTAKEREERFWKLNSTFQNQNITNQPYIIYENHVNNLLKLAD